MNPRQKTLLESLKRSRRPGLAVLLVGLHLVIQAFGDQSVTIAWDPNPEPDLLGYAIYYGTSPRTYPMCTNVGNTTVATIEGLSDLKTYYFAITAVNTSGIESDFSDEIMLASQFVTLNVLLSTNPIGPWNVVFTTNMVPLQVKTFLRSELRPHWPKVTFQDYIWSNGVYIKLPPDTNEVDATPPAPNFSTQTNRVPRGKPYNILPPL